MAKTFRANKDRPDLRLNINSKAYILLTEQWRACCNMDGSRKKQNASPMIVLRKMHEMAIAEWKKAMCGC